mgnify:CR=1 FL=1
MYEFATGVIDVWEKKILSALDQERMLKAPDKGSAFMVLFDTDLSEFISGKAQQVNIEEVFLQDLSTLKAKLNSILDDRGLLTSFLFLKFDALNLKDIFKKIFFEENTKNFRPFEVSIEPYKKVEGFVRNSLKNSQKDGSFAEKPLNVYVETLALQALKVLNNIKDEGQIMGSQAIERAVDRAYFKVKLSLAKKENALLEMTRLEIDLANLRNLLGKGGQIFLEGGNLTNAQIKGLAEGKEEDLSNNLKKFLEGLELEFLLEGLEGKVLDTAFERKLDSYIAKKIFQKEKEKGSGIEKVLAFFQKKMNSYTNIRLILFAKENNLKVEEIEKVLLPI